MRVISNQLSLPFETIPRDFERRPAAGMQPTEVFEKSALFLSGEKPFARVPCLYGQIPLKIQSLLR